MNTHLSKANKTVFLFGPTAVGKTGLLCSLFSSEYELVNADSIQVYRQLNIGSAKADEQERKAIKHHLVDILDPWEEWNVADFIRLADAACEDIRKDGKYPVISGGTAFYFKNYMYGLSRAPQANPEIRAAVKTFMEETGNQLAHKYLKSIDPISAERINPNDTYRISRAIEVYRTCGRPLSDFAVPTTVRNDMDILLIGLVRDKEELKIRIEKRVDKMLDDGLVEEIRGLIAQGASLKWQSMQAIGYSEFFKEMEEKGCGLDGVDVSKVRDNIIMDSIHYAKRQMTFFRSFPDVHWMNPDDQDEIKKLLTTFRNNQ